MKIKGEMEKQKARILVVDDEPFMRNSLKKLLESKGYIVDVAEDGDEAVRKYKELEPNPDIVITDLVMSGITGLEEIKEIKKYDPNAVILIESVHGEFRDEVFKAGASDFLEKTFTIEELYDIIEQQLEKKRFEQISSKKVRKRL